MDERSVSPLPTSVLEITPLVEYPLDRGKIKNLRFWPEVFDMFSSSFFRIDFEKFNVIIKYSFDRFF